MDRFLNLIDDFIYESISNMFIADEKRYVIAMISFAICIVLNVILAMLSRKNPDFAEKGITLGVLSFDSIIAFTAVMLCNFILAIIITIIVAIIMPTFEKREINSYLKKEIKITPKRYLLYGIVSFLSASIGFLVIA